MKRLDAITYANTLSGDVAVYLGARRIGTIVHFIENGGYAYVPAGRGGHERGEIYPTVEKVKRSLEEGEEASLTQTQDPDWTGADDCVPIEPAGTGSFCSEHIWQAACSAYRDERGYLVDAGERWCRVVRRKDSMFLQQGKFPLPQSGADADARADVSWGLWRDGEYLLAEELLSLKAKAGGGSVGPFPKEPLAGSQEAIERAAETIFRGTQLRCWRCGQLASTRVPEDTVVRGTLECPECSSAVIGAFERENSQLREQLDERIRRHEADARDFEACRKAKEEETSRVFKAEQEADSLADALKFLLRAECYLGSCAVENCCHCTKLSRDDKHADDCPVAVALAALSASGRLP